MSYISGLNDIYKDLIEEKNARRSQAYKIVLTIYIASNIKNNSKAFRTAPSNTLVLGSNEARIKSVPEPVAELFAKMVPIDMESGVTISEFRKAAADIVGKYVFDAGIVIRNKKGQVITDGREYYAPLKEKLYELYIDKPLPKKLAKLEIGDGLITGAYEELKSRAGKKITTDRKSKKKNAKRKGRSEPVQKTVLPNADIEKIYAEMKKHHMEDEMEKLIIPIRRTSQYATLYLAHESFFGEYYIDKIKYERRAEYGRQRLKEKDYESHFYYLIVHHHIDHETSDDTKEYLGQEFDEENILIECDNDESTFRENHYSNGKLVIDNRSQMVYLYNTFVDSTAKIKNRDRRVSLHPDVYSLKEYKDLSYKEIFLDEDELSKAEDYRAEALRGFDGNPYI